MLRSCLVPCLGFLLAFIRFVSISLFFSSLFFFTSFSLAFTLEPEILPPDDVNAGMLGYMLTVKLAQDIVCIPVEVISVIPAQKGNFILIRLIDAELAQGMSGSPVYIDGKLIGAVRSGWENSGHELALVIPIGEMIEGASALTLNHSGKELTLMRLSGLSTQNASIQELSHKLNVPIMTANTSHKHGIRDGERLTAGSSITVYLVWGDAELSALGTVTAVDKAGNFLAFGHEFLKRGTVRYPCGGAYIHGIVNSENFPLKLSSSCGINGTVTSDTDSGIGGKFGQYALSIPCEVELHDIDSGRKKHYTFRTIADEYLSDELIASISRGLCEEAYGRKGEGTISIRLNIDGKNIPEGFAYKNIYYSDSDIMTESFNEVKGILKACLTQPYSEILPCGISIKAQVTRKPKVLLIEEVTAPLTAKPGESIDISIKLRGYRQSPITHSVTLRIPEDARGIMEIIVRGGGTQSFKEAGIAGGWKSIDSLEKMLTELRAQDTNGELIVELNIDHTGNFLSSLKSGKKPVTEPDLLPEEEEYLSETKARRKREGTLKILDSEYYIDGLMRRIIHTEGE